MSSSGNKTVLREVLRLSNLRRFESEIHCSYDYELMETIEHPVFNATSTKVLLKSLRAAEKECLDRIRVLDECWLASQNKIRVAEISSIDGMMAWIRSKVAAKARGRTLKLTLPLSSGHYNTYLVSDPESGRYAVEEIALILEGILPDTHVTRLTRHLVRQHVYDQAVLVDPLSAHRIFTPSKSHCFG